MGLIADVSSNIADNKSSESRQNSKDEEIQNRLQRLKEKKETTAGTSNEEIQNRLQKIKGDTPKINDAELQERLAKLRGLPVSAFQSQVYSKKNNLRHK